MPQIGPLEILVIAAIALIVFGPEKLPEIARTIGRTANQLRRMASDVKDEFQFGLDDVDDEPAAPIRHRGTATPAPSRKPASGPSDPAAGSEDDLESAGAPPRTDPREPAGTGASESAAPVTGEKTTPGAGGPEPPLGASGTESSSGGGDSRAAGAPPPSGPSEP